MLIGENQINEIFNEWLEDNGFDARIAGLEPDFGWYMSSDTIAYSFVVAEKFDKAFQRVCEDLGLNYEIDIFWLSFFHELGHSETYHCVDEAAFLVDADLLGDDYYYHPREIIATEWAVDYINTNIDKVKMLMQMVRPAIVRFFTVNNIQSED